MDKPDFTKIKMLSSMKNTVKRIKSKPHWKKIFA